MAAKISAALLMMDILCFSRARSPNLSRSASFGEECSVCVYY